MFKILILIFLSFNLFANQLKIASYNVENLFDLENDGSEYDEFIPNSKSQWNQRNFNIKFNNLIKVINDLDADIIALQEIENKELIKLLSRKLPKYKYNSFVKYNESAVGLGILSKIEIKNTRHIDIKFRTRSFRPILETTFVHENVEFKIFNNHWPSKAFGESYRVKYAKGLQDRIIKIENDYDYILLGDFNSNYDEFQTFRNSQTLNNTRNIAGINQILNTTLDEKFITYDDMQKPEKRVHYNLWLDIPTHNRFSTKFRNQNNTPDSIIIPPALFDNKKLSYIPNSFEVFKPDYLFENNKPNRWLIEGTKFKKIHKGEGFSDHLPIYAYFSLKKEDRNLLKNISENEEPINTISSLYQIEKLKDPVLLENIIVLYKEDDKAIIKKENDRAIFVFKGAQSLKEGYIYDIQVNKIFTYNGLKEIKEFVIVDEKKEFENYKSLYLDGSSNDVLDFKNMNEIVTNLKGVMKNTRLYIDEKRYIKLYSKDIKLLPKNKDEVTILNGHLGVYRGNMQINIYNTTDYKVGN